MTFTPPTPNTPKPKIIYNKSDNTIETVGPIPVHDFDFCWDSDQSTDDFVSAFLSPTTVTEFDFSFSTLLTKVDFVVQEHPTAPDQRIQEIKDYYDSKNLLTIRLEDVKDNTPVYDIELEFELYSEEDRFDTGHSGQAWPNSEITARFIDEYTTIMTNDLAVAWTQLFAANAVLATYGHTFGHSK